MASIKAMPPEPVLDLKAPAVLAAMRVMGIQEKDLQAPSRDSKQFASLSESAADLRFETFERKRRELLKSIADTAKAGAEAHERHNNESVDLSSAMADVQRREADTIEKLRKRAKGDVQKIALQELAAKQLMEETRKKQADSLKRFQAIAKEKEEALKEQQAIAAKKQEKYTAARIKADQDRENKANAVYENLLATMEKKGKVIAEREEAWKQERQRKNAESQKIEARLQQFERDAMTKRENQYEQFCSRHDSHARALQAKRDGRSSNAEALRQKIDHAVANAKQCLETKEQKSRQKHELFLDHEDQVRVRRQTMHKEKWTEINAEKKKARQAFEGRFEKIQKDIVKRQDEGLERMTRSKSDTTALDFKNQTYSAQSLRIKENHEVLEDLVNCNRDRIARANHHHLKERLKKISNMKDRMAGLDESKFNIQQRRYDAMKNCAIEKMELQHQVDVLRDAPERRLKQLFKELGLDVKPKEAEAEKGEKEEAKPAVA